MKTDYLLTSTADMYDLIKILGQAAEEGQHIVTIRRAKRQRTISQNKSLHLYCEEIAEKLTDGGYTQRKLWDVLKHGFDLPVTMEMVKDVFRSVGKAMFKKESTADLTTIEIQEVYTSVDQGFAETTGCHAEWPSMDSLVDKNNQWRRQ